MQTDIHANWKGKENTECLRILREHCKAEGKTLSGYMIEATKRQMKKEGIISKTVDK